MSMNKINYGYHAVNITEKQWKLNEEPLRVLVYNTDPHFG